MKEIDKLVIRSLSGYCPVEMAYEDKLTVEKDSISYQYKPVVETENNPQRKWRYTSNSPEFLRLFYEMAAQLPFVMELSNTLETKDAGNIHLYVTFTDRSKWSRESWMPIDCYQKCFSYIRKMIPTAEMMPPALSGGEDK